MKKEELFEAINDIDEQEIEAAGQFAAREKNTCEKTAVLRKRASWTRWGTLAACLVVAVAAVALGKLQSGRNGGIDPAIKETESRQEDASQNHVANEGVKVVSAKIPAAVAEGMSLDEFLESSEHNNWYRDYTWKIRSVREYQSDMRVCYAGFMEKLLKAEDENTVCSPLNIYLALSVLAETGDGNTRQQILDLLGVLDVETLRTRVSDLMESNYANTPALKSQLANSLWLNSGINFNRETLDRLAETYLASTYSGTMGSAEMNKALQEWTDSNTGGLLQDYTKDLKLDPETVMALVSTLYYKASWEEPFEEKDTKPGVFHGTKGDTDVQMMHQVSEMTVYRTEAFTALSLNLVDSGAMHFFLPQEGVDVNALLSDPDLFEMMSYENEEKWSDCFVTLSIPKYDIEQKSDLKQAMKELGITDAFDMSVSDFTPLTADLPLFIGTAEHAARVELDENGVTGSAYTFIGLEGSTMPEKKEEIDFTLDRPFMFVVTGTGGSVLFAGVVRNVE